MRSTYDIRCNITLMTAKSITRMPITVMRCQISISNFLCDQWSEVSLLGERIGSSCHHFRCFLFFLSSEIKWKQFFPANSLEMIFYQHFLHQFFHFLRDLDIWGEVDGSLVDEWDQPSNSFFLERTETKKHLIQDNSQWPYISFHGINLSFEYFRCHINGWAKHGLWQILAILQRFTKPKISQFNHPII